MSTTPHEPISVQHLSSDVRAAVVAINMGYGHQRPARSIATQLGGEVLHADRPPLADQEEQARWGTIRRVYENVSRISSLPWAGPPFRLVLNSLTNIAPLYPFRDLSSPSLAVSFLERSARKGLGRSMVAYLEEHDLPLLTTFYSPAVLADYHGYDRIYCIVTDSDVNRVWAPIEPSSSKIHYFAPSGRVVRRLRAYGVNKNQIELTGFPLPHALVGGPLAPTLRSNLAARLARLDPKRQFRTQYAAELSAFDALPEPLEPFHLVFAVGGAGAQAELSHQFLPSLRDLLRSNRMRLTLVAGVRPEVREQFEQAVERAGLQNELGSRLSILFEPDIDAYLERFDALLAGADVLWTKPSEMVFYAALGLPLLLSEPIGVHENYNRRFARENGAAFSARDPNTIAERLQELLDDGLLAAAAWAGYKRLPHFGLYRVLDRLRANGS
jgi:glycosyltransferase involved in cell wall biosynthesis